MSHASTDLDRYVLNGVYFDTDAQAVVATDGRRLAVIPAKVTGKSRVIASNDVKKPKSREIAYKKGSVIEGNYPNWKQVVPDTKGYTKTQIDIESVRRKAAVGASIVNMVDVKGAPVTPASLQASNGSVLNPSFVQDAVETLIASGAKTITLETTPISPPSGPSQWLFQGPPAESKLLAASGSATYVNKFQISNHKSQISDLKSPIHLDLGTVHAIAKVRVNGKEIATLWKEPYTTDITAALRQGSNTLEVEVINSWHNRLVGDRQPGATPTTNKYHAGTPLQPSGMLGPVRLVRRH